MKKYTFTEIMKAGHEIKIFGDPKHNERYTATVYRYKNGKYYFDNAEMIEDNICHSAMTPERFENHINTMINEGFRVLIFTP